MDDLEQLKQDISQAAVVKAAVVMKRRAQVPNFIFHALQAKLYLFWQARVAGRLYRKFAEELTSASHQRTHKSSLSSSSRKSQTTGGFILVRVLCGDLPRVVDKSKLSVAELASDKDHEAGEYAKKERKANKEMRESQVTHVVNDTGNDFSSHHFHLKFGSV